MKSQRRLVRPLGVAVVLAVTTAVAAAAPAAGSIARAAGSVAGSTSSPASPGNNGNPHPGVGETSFVDCSATTPGDGTDNKPFNSLAQASAATFGPGDQVLFKRGVTCVGTFKTSAKGTQAAPVTIAGYGNPKKRAVLNGGGAPTVVHLFNSEHVVIDGLEITNPANPTPISQRGITVQLQDFGTGSGYTIKPRSTDEQDAVR